VIERKKSVGASRPPKSERSMGSATGHEGKAPLPRLSDRKLVTRWLSTDRKAISRARAILCPRFGNPIIG
jgi:hypothetical protein